MPSIPDRLTAWWRARQRRRIWNALTPEQQMTTWATAIDSSPELREMFRKVLRVHGYERTAGDRRRPRR